MSMEPEMDNITGAFISGVIIGGTLGICVYVILDWVTGALKDMKDG